MNTPLTHRLFEQSHKQQPHPITRPLNDGEIAYLRDYMRPVRLTTIERRGKTAEQVQRARHYIGLGRQYRREQRLDRMVAYFRTDRARRLVDIACYAMIGWAAAIIAVALIAGAVR